MTNSNDAQQGNGPMDGPESNNGRQVSPQEMTGGSASAQDQDTPQGAQAARDADSPQQKEHADTLDIGVPEDLEPVTAKEGKTKRTVKQEILSWIGLLLTAVAIATLVRALLIEPIRVDGRSMLETLQDGEIVLVTKPKMLLGMLERGDVVICRFPTRETEYTLPVGASLDLSLTAHTLFLKRLVALPGDSVAVTGGVLYVNDEAVDEPYITYVARTDYPRRVLDRDQYMVMGDNRANSHDSRSSDVGPLTKDMIVGRAAFVLFPFSRIGMVK